MLRKKARTFPYPFIWNVTSHLNPDIHFSSFIMERGKYAIIGWFIVDRLQITLLNCYLCSNLIFSINFQKTSHHSKCHLLSKSRDSFHACSSFIMGREASRIIEQIEVDKALYILNCWLSPHSFHLFFVFLIC